MRAVGVTIDIGYRIDLLVEGAIVVGGNRAVTGSGNRR
jgi:hypothetical protein